MQPSVRGLWIVASCAIAASSTLACSPAARPAPAAAVASAVASTTGAAQSTSPKPDTPAAPPSGAPEPAGFVPDPALGQLAKVVCVDDLPPPPKDMTAWLSDLAPMPDGSVWIVGAPSIRVHMVGRSLRQDVPKPLVSPCHEPQGASACDAHSLLGSLALRGGAELFVAGTVQCGYDPDTSRPRGVESHDGTSWRPLPQARPCPPTTTSPSLLATAAGSDLYAIAQRALAPAYPDLQTIQRYQGGRWRLLREGVSQRVLSQFERALADPGSVAAIDPKLEYEQYAAIQVLTPDVVWIAGSRNNVHGELTQRHDAVGPNPPDLAQWQQGTVWRLAGGQWSQLDVGRPALRALSAVSRTEAWAVGGNGGLWHISGDRAEQVPVPLPSGDGLTALWATASGQIWLATERRAVLVLHDGRTRQVAQLDDPRGLGPFRGQGDDVWLVGSRCVWRWQRPK